MSVTRATTMSVLPTAEERDSGSPKSNTRHSVLSGNLPNRPKIFSVPYLLNIPRETGTSGTDKDPNSALTPPASSTMMQFPSPQELSGGGRSVEGSPLETRNLSNPTSGAFGGFGSSFGGGRRRQSSMDSLMRAAATVENENELNQLYQDKLGFIIELKNCISDEIRNWPVVQDPEASPSTPSGGASKVLLDRISGDQLNSLGNVVSRLKETVEELAELKSQTPHIKENMASRLQRDLRLSSTSQPQQEQQRKIVLPPMETLTMNLPHQERSSLHDYRFPSGPSTPATTIPPPPSAAATESQQQQQQQQRHYQESQQRHDQPPPHQYRPPPHHHRVISSWPSTVQSRPTEKSHRFTLSDSSSYAGGGAAPVIFQSPHSQPQPFHSVVPGKKKNKNPKFQKKRKKSLPEISLAQPQNYRRSLTQGFLATENVRQNEQGTAACVHCKEGITPEWRRGPYGNRTLCNACGLFYRKLIKKFSTRDANILMRYKRQVNPEDRRVPSSLDVPESFIAQLENDPNLDSEFNTIGGLASN